MSVSRRSFPKSSQSVKVDSNRVSFSLSREHMLGGIIVLLVAALAVVSIGLSSNPDTLGHLPDQIKWSAIASKTDAGAPELVQAINNASSSAPGQLTRINADTLDGKDSLELQAGAGNGSGTHYERYCGWVIAGSGAVPTGGGGASTSSYYSSVNYPGGWCGPPQCDVGDSGTGSDYSGPGDIITIGAGLGVDCFPTGLDMEKNVYEQDPGSGNWIPLGSDWVMVGECVRTCKKA